jgi:succinyl-diaminopimelate desuccinylase
MKSGLAVMLALAGAVPEPAMDVSWVFYEAEEVDSRFNGLGRLFRERPDLVAGDVALLGEPTGADIEAGCQGTMRVQVVVRGARAHTARPWTGRNAIHRLGRLLTALSAYEERRPIIDGCEFREAVQAVRVEGGVAGNVVPDAVTLTINHRFAPDRDVAKAEEQLRRLIEPTLEPDDEVELVDVAAGAAPALGHSVLATLIERNGLSVRAKLGWTDVARFAARGVPAVNFGPGDPEIAHTQGEFVTRASIENCYDTLGRFVGVVRA